MLRNQTRGQENLSLADFIAPKGDWIGCFAVTAGIGLKELCENSALRATTTTPSWPSCWLTA